MKKVTVLERHYKERHPTLFNHRFNDIEEMIELAELGEIEVLVLVECYSMHPVEIELLVYFRKLFKEKTKEYELTMPLEEFVEGYNKGEFERIEMDKMKRFLWCFSRKIFVLKYKRKSRKKAGGHIEERTDQHTSIVNTKITRQREFNEKYKKINKKEEVTIFFDPIFNEL